LNWREIAKTDEAHPAEHDAAIGDCWADLVDDQRAEQAYRRYWELRPQHPEGWIDVCRLRLLQGKFAEAKTLCAQNGERYKEFAFSRQMEAQVAFFTGDFAEAEKLYTHLAKADEAGGDAFYSGVTYQSALGWLRNAAGDDRGQAILLRAKEKELRNLAATPKNPDVLYRLAAIESSLSEREAALDHLRSAMEEGWIDYRSLEIDPRFSRIRELPGYRNTFDDMKQRVASLRLTAHQISKVRHQ
jgi:tetratricopeptide (TPR) repeat protein